MMRARVSSNRRSFFRPLAVILVAALVASGCSDGGGPIGTLNEGGSDPSNSDDLVTFGDVEMTACGAEASPDVDRVIRGVARGTVDNAGNDVADYEITVRFVLPGAVGELEDARSIPDLQPLRGIAPGESVDWEARFTIGFDEPEPEFFRCFLTVYRNGERQALTDA